MADACGMPVQDFTAAYKRDRLELDRGTLDLGEYWRRILSRGRITPAPGLLDRINKEDTLSWTGLNQAVIRWSGELQSAGFRTAILSNMPRDKLLYMRSREEFRWMEDFSAAVFSCDIGTVKPEPGIYRLCLKLLGSEPEECIFIDDVPANIEGARLLGMHAILHRSEAETARDVRRIAPIPVENLLSG
jgi:putative hydrolase of the HAD superfamily